MSKLPEPTRSELEILQVLWAEGPATVRTVNDRLNEHREVNYTSTLKLMQIMTDKGLLTRDESQMKHIYHVVEKEEKTKSILLEKFIDTMYNGSAAELMMQLMGNKKTSREDLKAVKALLDKLDSKEK